MGAPQEYFNYGSLMLEMAARLKVNTIRDYVYRLFELRTSPNGVFAFKGHWYHFRFVAGAGLLRFFPGLRFIHIERRDRLAQAVSAAKKQQTKQSTSMTHPSQRRPVYDRGTIQRALARFEYETVQWNAMFRRSGIEPVRVVYESLVADPDAIVDDILRRFGFTRDPACYVEVPRLERLSDSVNSEWIERFRRETATP